MSVTVVQVFRRQVGPPLEVLDCIDLRGKGAKCQLNILDLLR